MKNRHVATLLVLIFAIAISSCADRIIADTNPERPTYKPSPTVVVDSFLKALKDEDFKKAYKYAYTPSSDEAGYIIEMRNIYKKHQLRINSFEILGTHIYDITATVVVELDSSFKSPTTGKIINLSHKDKYNLGLFDKKWKVTRGECFENCLEEVPEIQIDD